MARTIVEIKQSIVDQKDLEPDLDSLNSPSQTAIYNLFMYIVAVAIYLHESIWDIFKVDLENIAATAVAGTAKWLQKKVLEFQFDAVTPQVIEVIDGVASYPIVDATKRIITRASVKQTGNKIVSVKVAKGSANSLEPLTTEEKTALSDYLDDIKLVGTEIIVVSQEADRLKVTGTVYYKGQYVESVVKAAVIAAIDNYLATFSNDIQSFDGTLIVNKLIDAVQAVPGVNDFVITEIKGRNADQTVADGTPITRTYESVAGYIISEDTAGHTLNDTLTMVLG
jgi:hypothetical protein